MFLQTLLAVNDNRDFYFSRLICRLFFEIELYRRLGRIDVHRGRFGKQCSRLTTIAKLANGDFYSTYQSPSVWRFYLSLKLRSTKFRRQTLKPVAEHCSLCRALFIAHVVVFLSSLFSLFQHGADRLLLTADSIQYSADRLLLTVDWVRYSADRPLLDVDLVQYSADRFLLAVDFVLAEEISVVGLR